MCTKKDHCPLRHSSQNRRGQRSYFLVDQICDIRYDIVVFANQCVDSVRMR